MSIDTLAAAFRAASRSMPTPSTTSEYIWYAAYGSNLEAARFRVYIEGGKHPNAETIQPGCTNRELWTASEPLLLPFPLYFADSVASWDGGGAAFIELPPRLQGGAAGSTTGRLFPIAHPPNPRTRGRAYRIRRSQFLEIVAQENGLTPDRSASLFTQGGAGDDAATRGGAAAGPNFASLHAAHVLAVNAPRYDRLLYLGDHISDTAAEPVYTFTTAQTLSPAHNYPSLQYLLTIVRGILQVYPDTSDLTLTHYLEHATARERRGTLHPATFGYWPAPRSGGQPSSDFAPLIARAREIEKVPAPAGHFARVLPTENRDGAHREYIAVLPRDVTSTEGIAPRKLIRIERSLYPRAHLNDLDDGYSIELVDPPHESLAGGGRTIPCRVLAAPAVIQNWRASKAAARVRDDMRPGTVRLDQKIRIALGVNIGDVVEIVPGALPPKYTGWRRRWNALTARIRRGLRYLSPEFLLGTQAQLMRIDYSAIEDMETPVARISAEDLTVLGIDAGDHIEVTAPNRQRQVLRAAMRTDRQVQQRINQRMRQPRLFVTPYKLVDLQRVTHATVDYELPTITIDIDIRHRGLGVEVGDVVRVVRAPTRNIGLRYFLILGPAILAAAGFVEKPLTAVFAAGAVLLLTTLLVALDIRSKIATRSGRTRV